MSSCINKENEVIPSAIIEAADKATLDLLPSKSRQQYEIAYKRFMEWCRCNNVIGKFCENVLLAYFKERSKIWKSSTLWSHFSMIKLLLNIKDNLDISKYYKLIAFLKRKGEGYRPKKSKILTRQEIDRFIFEASDEKYMMFKVAVVMGIFGACRREELCRMTVDDIEDRGNVLVVTIPDTKTNTQRIFTVIGSYINLYRKYKALRPSNIKHRRLFIKYANNKCTSQAVGINSFGKMPAIIAMFLKLPNPESYTGHCFRRSSATLLADSGANLCSIKRHGGWKSSTVAEGYLEDSLENKNKIAHSIFPDLSNNSIANDNLNHDISVPMNYLSANNNSASTVTHGINISNCTNCTFNINYPKNM